MKYDHAVIYNGTFYPTGAEVPVEKSTAAKETVKKNDRGTSKKS